MKLLNKFMYNFILPLCQKNRKKNKINNSVIYINQYDLVSAQNWKKSI